MIRKTRGICRLDVIRTRRHWVYRYLTGSTKLRPKGVPAVFQNDRACHAVPPRDFA